MSVEGLSLIHICNGRVEMPEYPEQAVHEVIVNALIHRDYMEIGSEVHIDIFDDRMEVYLSLIHI